MTKSKKMKEEIHNDRMISDDIIQVGNVFELNLYPEVKVKVHRFVFVFPLFLRLPIYLLPLTLYLMQLSPRNRKAMHMQSRVLKNERRLFAWRGGRARRGCEELLWLGMNNVCRVNSQPRACLAALA